MDLEILLLGEFSLGAASTGPRQQMFKIYKWSGAQGDRGLSQLREYERSGTCNPYHIEFQKSAQGA